MKPIPLLSVLVLAFIALPSEAHYINHRAVEIVTRKENWFKASETCRRKDMTLVSIHSAGQNKDVAWLANEYGLESLWIDATDLGESRKWVWSGTGAEVKEFFWEEEESTEQDQNCIEVDTEGHWKTVECGVLRPFICQKIK